MDRAISDVAKVTINRKLVELEERRAQLQAALEGLRESASGDTEKLAQLVRETFDEARANLAAAITPEAFNRFVERFVGPIKVDADGIISQAGDAAEGVLAQKEMPVADATGISGTLTRYIAGGRSATKQKAIVRAAMRLLPAA